jgi:L-ascorbate 6-phosphate lactonase
VVKPGDTIKIKDIEIVALDSFDRTCIVTTDSTGADREELTGVCPTDMDEKAVNYLVKTPGGNIYHSGDSHFSIYFAKHGKDYDIDVAFGSFGENPIGMQDKMTSPVQGGCADSLGCMDQFPGRLRGNPCAVRFQKSPQRIQIPSVLLAGGRQIRLSAG